MGRTAQHWGRDNTNSEWLKSEGTLWWKRRSLRVGPVTKRDEAELDEELAL